MNQLDYLSKAKVIFSEESKNVNIAKMVEDVQTIFQKHNFSCGQGEFVPKTLKKTEIYYDRPFNGRNFNNYMFCGGFCRQIVLQNSETNFYEVFVEQKNSMSSKLKKFKLNRPVKAEELKTELKINSKLFQSNTKVESDVLIVPFVLKNKNGNVDCVIDLFVECANIENIYSQDKKQVTFVDINLRTQYKYMYKHNEEMCKFLKRLAQEVRAYLLGILISSKDNKYYHIIDTYFEDVSKKAVPLPF